VATNTARFRTVIDDKVSGTLDRIADKFDRLGGKGSAASLFGNVGAKAVAKGFDLIGRAADVAVDFIGDSIGAASDLNETLSKSRVIFGDVADDVEDFGDTTADALGISKQAAIEAAATFGNLFVGLDLGTDKAADMSKELVGLAGDLASFNNLDPTEVLDKLRSGLAGESEPLRSLGVFLNEAKVKAKAMELGLADAHGELTEGAKVQARYALILEETTTAQGDFARTAEGAANKQRIQNARLKDAQAILGQKLLPLQLKLTDALIEAIPVIEKLADALGLIIEAAGKAGAAIDFLADRYKDLRNPIGDVDQDIRDFAEAGASASEIVIIYGKSLDEARAIIAEARKEQIAANKAIDAGRHHAGGASKALDTLADAAADTEKPMIDVATAAERIAEASGKAEDALSDLSGAMFGTDILTGDLAQAQRDLATVLKEGPETKKAQDVRIWRGEVAKARQDVFDLQAELAKQQGPKAFYDWLILQKSQIDKNDVAARKYLDDLIKLAIVSGTATAGEIAQSFPIPSKYGPTPQQHGGPVSANTPYIVGEAGRELFIPKTDGQIIPNDQLRSGAWSGGMTTRIIQLVVDGRVLADVVDRENYYRLAGAGAR